VLLPTLALLLIGQKFFKRNLNAGGTKGWKPHIRRLLR
jgi:sn-glycerol 3-phosphate transport system permease protein